MLKDQFPDAKYIFRGLILTEISYQSSSQSVSLTHSFGSAKKEPLEICGQTIKTLANCLERMLGVNWN